MENKIVSWLWYPGDFEIHQGMLQNFQREERGMNWPAYWYIDDCNHNVSFKRTYNLNSVTDFCVHAKGIGYVDINGSKCQLGKTITCGFGRNEIQIFVANATGLPSIYIEGNIVRSDKGWLVSNFVESLPAGCDPLYTKKYQDPNVIDYKTKIIKAKKKRPINGGVLFDFGCVVNGTLKLSLANSKKITICYGESKTEALDICNCYYKQENVDVNTIIRKRAFRYIFVPNINGKNIDVIAIHEFIPKDNPTIFESDNPLINKIWDVSIKTINLCSDLFFIDGVKRDRWIWGGDAYQANFINQYSFFNEAIDRRTLLALRGQNDIKQHINTIVDYSILWVISIYNHYQMTGDKEFLKIIYPKMKSMVEYFIRQTDDKGFIYGRKNDWIFIDWSEIDRTGTVAAEQILLLRAYEAISSCGKVLGLSIIEYQQKYNILYKNIMHYFWDNQKGAFIDSYKSGKRHVTRHANILAILFNIVDDAKQQLILNNVLLNDDVTQITTPYFKFFEQDALCKLGKQEQVYQTLLNYWGGMLDRDATTFWEKFDPDQQGKEMYEMYGDPYGKSLCHAWGASPIYLLGRYFIGLKPTKPGYETFKVTPKLADFKSLHAVMPIKNGTVTIDKVNNRLAIMASRAGGSVDINGKIIVLKANVATNIIE